MITHDIIIVGGGLAGMRAAIETCKTADTALISKTHPLRSHSICAQGGVNAALDWEKDPWESHAFDTIKGSDYLADQDAVEILCKESRDRIYELDHWGAIFDKTHEGKIAQKYSGGASYPRCCYSGDVTGHEMMQTYFEQILKNNIQIYVESFVTSLLVENGKCTGLTFIDLKTGELEIIRAKAVILATGGCGRTYLRSTNSLQCTGDGMALAYNVGAGLKDMEFIQFHPTTLFGTNILISETVRGVGGYLLNANNERFMARYAPDKMELAPRDIVSRSMQTEILEGRGIDNEYFLLDMRHLDEDLIRGEFAQVYDIAKSFGGIDALKEPIPVQPAQHYTMGGIKTNIWGETSIKGLFAAGECACVSVHGANRLGGNSLMEAMVFGRRAGIKAVEYSAKHNLGNISKCIIKNEMHSLLNKKEGEKPSTIINELHTIMWNDVGIFREKNKLQNAFIKINELKERYKSIYIEDDSRIFNTDLTNAIELGFMLELSELITLGSINREESRGSHYRTDFQERDDTHYLKHAIAYKNDTDIRFEYDNVTITLFEPKERKY